MYIKERQSIIFIATYVRAYRFIGTILSRRSVAATWSVVLYRHASSCRTSLQQSQ